MTAAAARALAAAALAAALAGCTLGPDYRRPEVAAPASFRFEPKDVQASTDVAWWSQFGDPVLEALVAEALANNRDVKAAAANVEAANAVFAQARSPLYPQLGYQGLGQRATLPLDDGPASGNRIPDAATAYQAGLAASWELDLWGRVRRQSEAARANVLATDEGRRGVVLSLVASVASTYVQLCGLDAQLAVAKKTQGVYLESVKLFELQFEYGQVSQMNVAQATSQYENASAQIPALEAQIAQAENALSVLLARPPGAIARRGLDDLKLPAVPAGVPSALLERRPDLLQAEQQLVAANAQIGAAKALYFPQISLTGALGSASGELSQLFTGPARAWSYAGQLAGPIFTAGAVSGQVAQAEAQRKAALQSYEQAIANAFSDVANALVANAKLREQLAAQAKLVAALQDYSSLARLQFDGGYAPYSTVLQAEQSLFPAELQQAALRASLLNSAVSIYKAMGGGWVNVADAMTGGAPSPPAVPAVGF